MSGGVVVTTVALTGGLALAGSISNTGNKSINTISKNSIKLCVSVNNNSTGANTFTGQQASTGKASVSKNTNATGNATSGPAANTNSTGVTVTAMNTGSCATGQLVGNDVSGGDSSIDTTGPGSINSISSNKISLVGNFNNNSTWVGTTTLQNAQSGGASVSGNTNGGDANSGSSTNGNTTTILVTSTNQ